MIPPVVASDRGTAQTSGVARRGWGCRTATLYWNGEWKYLESYITEGDNAINKLVLSSKIDDNSLVPFIKDHLLAVHGQDLFRDISNETMMVNIGNIFINQEEE